MGYRKTLVVAVFASSLILTACTLHLNERLPDLDKQALAASGGKSNVNVVSHGVHLIKLPGATISLNASETLGNGDYGVEAFHKVSSFEVDASSGRRLRFNFFADGTICPVSGETFALLASGVRGALGRIMRRHVPHGTVDLYFMRRGPFIAKQVLSLRPGRSIELSLYQACDATNVHRAAADALNTVDMTMHELTHLIDALYLRQDHRTEDPERFADEAPSCLYEALATLPGGNELAERYPGRRDYEESTYHTSDSPPFDAHEFCGKWVSSIATLAR